jgi:hypothetical protein
MDYKKLATRVARSYMNLHIAAYSPEGEVERMIGETATQQLGLNDAPKKFFESVKSELKKTLGSLDPDDDNFHEELQSAVIEVAQRMDLIDEDKD